MLYFTETELHDVYVHSVGNKINDEGMFLSDKPASITEEQKPILLNLLLSQFEKVSNVVYEFFHPSGNYTFNKLYNATVLRCFDNTLDLSRNIASLLYYDINHPKIKRGDLFIVELDKVQYAGELHQALGIFKSENKETFLTTTPHGESFDLNLANTGVAIGKMDKGTIVLENGLVFCYDNDKSGFWKDDFLGLRVVNNDYNKTNNLLGIAKTFITEKLDEEFEISSTDKAELLNKSIQYFKEKESFDIDEFGAEVFGNAQAVSSFKDYKSAYGEEFDQDIPDFFEVSESAVKGNARAFKSVIKLDKNFHLYVHGNKDLIERGFDQEKGLNFYKVYFKEES